MKWTAKTTKIDGVPTVRKYFAFLPVRIKNEVRWLETVKVQGFWVFFDIDQKWHFIKEYFI